MRSRFLEYFALTSIVLGLVLLLIKPMVEETAASLVNSAEVIQGAIE